MALQLTAERAGLALACPFSSSDEFESAVVRAKLDAGIYGPKRQRRLMLYGGDAAVALLAIPVLDDLTRRPAGKEENGRREAPVLSCIATAMLGGRTHAE